MPKPRKGESHKDYMKRCIPAVMDEGTAKDAKQGYAVCQSFWEKAHKANRESRVVRLTGMAHGAQLRTAMFDGVEHVVVPVTCLLGDVVVRPMNSNGPEFVPAEELAFAPGGWNGRPIVPDHPNNGLSSANDPPTLETFSFGHVFNTRFEDGALVAEAWLNPSRASRVGHDAERVIERCRNREAVEVSVGAYVSLIEETGSHGGHSYKYRWSGIVPDHLAMLPEGVQGACSVDMGCGTPRAARAKGVPQMNNRFMEFLRRLAFIGAADQGLSDSELRNVLHRLLRSVEPGFDWVVEVFPDTSTVIYACMPEDKMLYMRRTFSKAGEDVSLNDDRAEVAPDTVWRRVDGDSVSEDEDDSDADMAAATASIKAACGCNSSVNGDGHAAPPEVEGEPMNVKELVGRLIANSASPFQEADRAALEAMSPETLQAIEKRLQDAAVPPVQEAVVTPPPEVKVEDSKEPVSEAEYIAQAPEGLRSLFARYQKQELAHRTALISGLTKATDVFTETQLRAKQTEELEALAKIAGVTFGPVSVDFSGRGMAVPVAASGVQEPPDPYLVALERKRQKVS